MLGPTSEFSDLLDPELPDKGRRIASRESLGAAPVAVVDGWARDALALAGIVVMPQDFIGISMVLPIGDRRMVVGRDRLYVRCRPDEVRAAVSAIADEIARRHGVGRCWFTAGQIRYIVDFDDDRLRAFGDLDAAPEVFLRCYYGHEATATHEPVSETARLWAEQNRAEMED